MLVLTVCAAWLVLVRCSNLQEPFMLADKVKIMAMASGRTGGHSILAPPANFKFHPDTDADEDIDTDTDTDSDILLLLNDEGSAVIEKNETENNHNQNGSTVFNTKLNRDNITSSDININNSNNATINDNTTISDNRTISGNGTNITNGGNITNSGNITNGGNITNNGNITDSDRITKNNETISNNNSTTNDKSDNSDNGDNSDNSDSIANSITEQTNVPTTDNPVDAQTMSTLTSEEGAPAPVQSVPWYSAVQRYPGAQVPAIYGTSAVMWSPMMVVLQPVVVPAQYMYLQPQILRPVQSSMKELLRPVQSKAQGSQRSEQESDLQELQRPVLLQYPSVNENLLGLQGRLQPYYRFL